MMKKIFLLSMIHLVISGMLYSQVGINDDASVPDASAMLDVKSISKGVLVPRMTESDRNSISLPATGLLVYQTDGTTGFYYNAGTGISPAWTYLGGGGLTLPFAGSTAQTGFAFSVTNSLSSGILGKSTSVSGTLFGVQGETASTQGVGLYGLGTSTTGSNFGVIGQSNSSSGVGVLGTSISNSGANTGVKGQSFSTTGTGVLGENVNGSGINYGIKGTVTSSDGFCGYFTGGKFYSSANVGLGTTSPASALHISRNAAPGVPLLTIHNTEDYLSTLSLSTNYYSYLIGQNRPPDATTLTDVFFIHDESAGTTRLLIDPDGHVGIGTTAPFYTMHVSASTGAGNPAIYCENGVADGLGIKGVNTATSSQGYLGGNNRGAAGTHSSGNYGVLGLGDAGVYGHHQASGNYGRLGTMDYGVYGFNNSSSNYCYLASNTHGCYAQIGNGSKGYFAVDTCGAYGYHGPTGNLGLLGDDDYGAYGWHSSGNYGYLGGNIEGVRGKNDESENWGSLGMYSNGVYGYLQNIYMGHHAVFGYCGNENYDGINYDHLHCISGSCGYTRNIGSYSFGVVGSLYVSPDIRSGGTLGSRYDDITPWGCLSYYSSSSLYYGGYFTSYSTGSGDKILAGNPSISCGIGAYGDLFGADIHGNIYGTFTEGKNYGLFSNGHIIQNNLHVHLQENPGQSNSVLYTNVSTEVTVQTSGYGQLTDGTCRVVFDEHFKIAASADYPIVVTVTPIGPSRGIYLETIDKEGFAVSENDTGRSNVTFTYIAIARRRGYEQPLLPEEVIAPDYLEKLARGLHNDSDTQTDGEGLYYENGKLIVGKPAASSYD